jgi:hypothetical protein
MNLYDSVFNMVIIENIDTIECIPNLEMYWETPWANFTTLRLIATQKQF